MVPGHRFLTILLLDLLLPLRPLLRTVDWPAIQ